MKRLDRTTALIALTFAMFAMIPSARSADVYPSRPIRIIVPFPAGQGADILTRLLGEQLGQQLGQPVVVENRAGAGGIIGTAAAARAAPDGYTLYMGSSGPLAISPNVYKTVNYDPVKDFAPISDIASVTQVMVTSPQSALTSVADLLTQARQHPGALRFASGGTGTTSQLTMELFAQLSQIRLVHVPYKGSPPAMIDVMAGRVDVMFDAIPGVLNNIKSRQLKALAVSSLQRSRFLPDVPTVAESGQKDFATVGWIGLLAPAGTPPAIIRRVHTVVTSLVHSKDIEKRMSDLAFTPIADSPDQFGAFIKSEVALWGRVAKGAGVQAQ